MAFCGKCGAQLKGEKFCPNCGAPVVFENNEVKNKNMAGNVLKGGMMKSIVKVIVFVAIAVIVIPRILSFSMEPCEWCGDRPSVAYKMSDGSKFYVCRDCSKSCVLCGNKATKHYESLLGTLNFVCDDCYDTLTEK